MPNGDVCVRSLGVLWVGPCRTRQDPIQARARAPHKTWRSVCGSWLSFRTRRVGDWAGSVAGAAAQSPPFRGRSKTSSTQLSGATRQNWPSPAHSATRRSTVATSAAASKTCSSLPTAALRARSPRSSAATTANALHAGAAPAPCGAEAKKRARAVRAHSRESNPWAQRNMCSLALLASVAPYQAELVAGASENLYADSPLVRRARPRCSRAGNELQPRVGRSLHVRARSRGGRRRSRSLRGGLASHPPPRAPQPRGAHARALTEGWHTRVPQSRPATALRPRTVA